MIYKCRKLLTECLLCTESFEQDDSLLAHFLLVHKLVIADIKEIVDLKKWYNLDCQQFKKM